MIIGGRALTSREEVRQVILDIRLLLSRENGLVFVDRQKNAQALTRLGVLPSEVPGILRGLRVEDYAAGPLDDDAGREEKWYHIHFGKERWERFEILLPNVPHRT